MVTNFYLSSKYVSFKLYLIILKEKKTIFFFYLINFSIDLYFSKVSFKKKKSFPTLLN